MAQVTRLSDYVASYPPPQGSGVTLDDAGFPIRRMPLAPLLERMWELRENVTPYAAAYVALAERIDGPLVTSDGKLTATSGPRCGFDVIT